MTETLLLYSLKSALVLSLLFIPYMLMLRKESFFQLNRCVLLTIIFLSLTLPLMNLHFLSIEDQPVVQAARSQMIDIGIPLTEHAITLPEVSISASETEGSTSWFNILAIIFCIMASFILLWRMWQIMEMKRAVRRGSLWHQEENGIHIYCHATDIAPYSWMNNIVISQKDFQENAREILLHEKAHIRARHSWDIIFLSFLEVIQWWNPLVYIMGSSLRDVHEYEADESVLAHGVSAKAYQLLLINKAVGASSYTFANSLNHSLILKRITMMQKSKSSWWMRAKVLYILPMATAALSAFATSESTSTLGNNAKDEDKVIKISSPTQEGKDISAILKHGNENVVYLLNGKEVPITETNNLVSDDITSVTIIKDDEATKQLGYSPDKTIIAIETKTKLDTLKVNVVEVPAWNPMFKGGDTALLKWINKNTKYPQIAQYAGIQGRIVVKFYVSETGKIFNVRAISIGSSRPKDGQSLEDMMVQKHAKAMEAQGKHLSEAELNAYKVAAMAMIKEAERVVREMPDWEPGYQDKDKKKPCTVSFVLPIMFRLG